jgi:hypothetical protein
MSSLIYRINGVLSCVVSGVYVGTNLGLFCLLWMLLSGRLLVSRGAVIPGLADCGLADDAVRRSWAALCYGKWQAQQLLFCWQQIVAEEGHFVGHRHGGYRPVACDLVGFFRPHLKNCPTKHYAPVAGKVLPAISLGVAARIGSVGEQRLAVPSLWVRADTTDQSEADLQARLLKQTNDTLAEDEAIVTDRGFPLAQIQAAGLPRYVSRGPTNFTARRACLPEYKGKGCYPKWGQIVRPLPRKRKGKTIAPTPPDRQETWQIGSMEEPLQVRALFWDNLVRSDQKPGAPIFSTAVIHDPRFGEPLLLNSPLPLCGADLQAMYRDRWPIEGLPLSAKQMIGAARQFVFAQECRQRLPELALLAGSILSYLAATQPAIPTGFWDRNPKPTSGRLRRVLAGVHFSEFEQLPEQLRKKQSPTEHLPKGVLGHRRHKKTQARLYDLPKAA